MIYKFYDTCSLLLETEDNLLNNDEITVISSITLSELEQIKINANKDQEIKFQARKLLHFLDEYSSEYIVHSYRNTMYELIEQYDFPITDDIKILCTMLHFKFLHPYDTVIFITNDLALKNIAYAIGENNVSSLSEDSDDSYTGYLDFNMSEDMMIDFYANPTENIYGLYPNEYIIIRDNNDKVVDVRCWTGSEYRYLNYKDFSSKYFGDIKPIKGDIYQALFADSLINNKITMVKGPAGSGKTFLSLAYLFSQLEKGKIDKIVIFCNTIATKNSAKLGFYPGTRNEKLLDSQIGNLLISKLGGRILVEQLIDCEKLVLLPLSDIRGYDTSGMNAGIYISEAQNMDISLIKLTLQRIGEDCICIIDGDCKTQVDNIEFAGLNNGMKRVSKVFRGEDIYGEVTLQDIHRSRIAQIAEFL